MTNYEWLLQMGGEERQAWFDAEHDEGLMDLDSCTHGMRTFASETDSREKLEEDVRKRYTHTVSTAMWPPSANKHTDMVSVSIDTVLGWLNRQAAITEREVEHDLMLAGRMAVEVERKRIAELTAERDELEMRVNGLVAELGDAEGTSIILERQRDEWKAKAEEAERAMNAAAGKWAKADEENRELRKMLALDDGTVEDYTERADPLTALAHQKQLAEEWRDRCHNAEALCDKLEAERDELREKLADTTEAISELMKKQPYTFDPHDVPGSLRLVGRYIDELELRLIGKPECDICDRTTLLEEVEGLTAERDALREKLGEAIGHAHEIGKLVDLEGAGDGR